MGHELIHQELREAIIGAAMTVLNVLKPGLDEKRYERALAIELRQWGHQVDPARERAVSFAGHCRHHGAGEAELGRFLKPLIHMAYGPHRAGQAHLAEIDGILGRGVAAHRGHERRRSGRVERQSRAGDRTSREPDRTRGRRARAAGGQSGAP